MPQRVHSTSDIQSRLASHGDKLRSLGVDALAIYGSFARGEATETSDIDLLVEFADDAKSFDTFMELNFFLEELLGRPVELTTVESLSRRFKDSIADDLRYVATPGETSRGHAGRNRLPDGRR